MVRRCEACGSRSMLVKIRVRGDSCDVESGRVANNTRRPSCLLVIVLTLTRAGPLLGILNAGGLPGFVTRFQVALGNCSRGSFLAASPFPFSIRNEVNHVGSS